MQNSACRFISAFDLDHTLLSVNSSYLFGKLLYTKGLISKWKLPKLLGSYALHKMNYISLDRLHQISFKTLFFQKKRSDFKIIEEEFIALAQEFIYLPAWMELRKAIDNQHYVILLSSSPDLIVELLAKFFNIENWCSTCYLVDKDEIFFKIDHIMDGERKAHYLRELKEKLQIGSAFTTVFSDSILDIPFLVEAGQPVAVNPDKKLRKLSLQHQWKII